MKTLLFSLAAVLIITGCNSDGGGSGGDGTGDDTNYNMTLTGSNADQMAAYAEIGRSLSTSAISLADSYAGRSSTVRASDALARNTDCYSYTSTGNDTTGSVTVTYNNCSYGGSYSFNGSMTVSWDGNSYDLSGNYSMEFSSNGSSFSMDMDPIEVTVVDDGSTITSTIEMTFTYVADGQAGKFTITTLEPLVGPSDPSTQDQINGKLQISDGTNSFTITYVDGNATVQ